MIYTSFSLNGTWQLGYSKDKYTSTEPPSFRSTPIKDAVPGYWEDMTDAFALAPFFFHIKFNPEYGIQQYPIVSESARDMALPNIIGNFYYYRTFCVNNITVPTAIHFEGVQNTVSLWINNVYVGRHEGYSTPFDINIPEGVLINGENTIILSVSNLPLEGYDGEPVSGLTSRAANECSGGITGNVELRFYKSPLRSISVFVSENCEEITAKIDTTETITCSWAIYDGETLLKSGVAGKQFTCDTKGLERWSPENPKLYTLKISHENSILSKKIGIRRLIVDGVHFKLNNIPYFLRGVCEHCYFPETVHPNHDIAYYRSMIKSFKKLGFNFIRFHTYIPETEYMQAADELGMLLHIESPNNTTVQEWREIVDFCKQHPSVVIYCCGNELSIDEPFAKHLNKCADVVHEKTDSLFSPLSALRGLEYLFLEPEQKQYLKDEPFQHNPRRFNEVGKFSDMYSSYANGYLSYYSQDGDPETLDAWSDVYKKPRVSHEICIDGTYTDLSLKTRYEGTRIGKTDMFASIERHLKSKGIFQNAPLYFKNSSEWQRRIRKYCFEVARRCNNLAGFDFLGPIDTHWHTFGYDVGMMNEFFELKPGETVRNVLMYNSSTVLLTDLKKKVNYYSDETFSCGIYTSCYEQSDIDNAILNIRFFINDKVVEYKKYTINKIKNGQVTKLVDFMYTLPHTNTPVAMKLYVSLDGNGMFTENEWELYLFPKVDIPETNNIIVSNGMATEELINYLSLGKDVLLLGAKPFVSLPTEFRISLAGRTFNNLATVIYDHPVLNALPHDGFCGWQFCDLMNNGEAVCFECEGVPFKPIIEVVSSHKYAIRQSALFEFKSLSGKLLVCTFNFTNENPMSRWLKASLISYMKSEDFEPEHTLTEEQIISLSNVKVAYFGKNSNLAFNINDKTAIRKKDK